MVKRSLKAHCSNPVPIQILFIHEMAPLLVDVSRFNNSGDTVLDVCHLECGLIEVKDETGADNVRR